MKRDQEELTFSLNTLYNLQHEWWCLLKECAICSGKKRSCVIEIIGITKNRIQ